MRIFYKTTLLFIFLLTALCLKGCQTFPDISKEKDGKQYGVTRGLFQARWWHFYERGLSFADGQFWKEAENDLQEAIRQRNNDQRQARTYGLLNLTDYFPHRELGIVLYRQGRIKESIKELTASLAMEKSAKAEFYLDLARKKMIEKQQNDHHPPEITIMSPGKTILTNAFSFAVRGNVRDDTFVRHIKVGDKDIRVDVSNREIPFYMETRLAPGENKITVLASDLSGKTSLASVRINTDRTGPVISIDQPFADDYENRTVLNGYAYDDSGLAELEINGKKIFLDGSQVFQIHKSVLLEPGKNELVIKAKDLAENVTSARLTVSDRADIREESALLAENASFPGNILADMPEKINPPNDSTPPDIKLTHLKEKQITYLDKVFIEGSVCDTESDMDYFRIEKKTVFRNMEKNIPGRKHFFSKMIELSTGENLITLWGFNTSGYSSVKTITIIRKIPTVQDIKSRLRVIVKHFIRTGNREFLSHGFENNLIKAMHERRRFIAELKFDPDNAENEKKNLEEILKNAAKEGFDCVLFGSVSEQDSNKSVNIYARMLDTETGMTLASADVYAEDADVDVLKELSLKMEMKLTDELPVAEGMVEKVNVSERQIDIDLGQETKIKKGMKLIVYQAGPRMDDGQLPDQDLKESGRARIEIIGKKKSVANLDKETDEESIKPAQRVITR